MEKKRKPKTFFIKHKKTKRQQREFDRLSVSLRHLPEKLNIPSKLLDIKYEIRQPGTNKIIVEANYDFNYAVYEAEDYRKLKYYCQQIVKRFNERIVLVGP